MSICKSFVLLVVALAIFGCNEVVSQQQNPIASPPEGAFNAYWYAGKAELTRYKLEQARYGEIHEGDAVFIFVTEDFRTDKQVKYEGGSRENVQSVLKLNFTRNFLTGIYPYSIMSSTFTPVEAGQPTLKVSTSVQEWCGNAFSQLNFRNGGYEGQLRSYFQNEGDREFTLPKALLEDEIWARVRLNPISLPLGEINVIPGTVFLRLKHVDFKVAKAQASLVAFSDPELSDKTLNKYRLEYKDLERVVEVTFETEFPYTIVAWEETTQSGFQDPQMMTTRAVRTHSIMSAYWGQNGKEDVALRKQLGL